MIIINISCGIIITNKEKILLGHVTNKNFWDIPKGIKGEDESYLECAIRELFEETGLKIDPKKLTSLGLFNYNKEKQLFLYEYIINDLPNIKELNCSSFFEKDDEKYPEIDNFKYFNLVEAHLHMNDKLSFIINKLYDIPFNYNQKEKIRRTICYILRHKINKETNGWLSLDELYDKCIIANPLLSVLDREDFLSIIELNKEDRFSIKGDLIKANYGHSVDIGEPELLETIPPNKLYHTTFDCFYKNIRKEGLKPMDRKYVFLATTKQKACSYYKKIKNNSFNEKYGYPVPLLLEIDSKAAYNRGIKFYKQNDNIICAYNIPPDLIKCISCGK